MTGTMDNFKPTAEELEIARRTYYGISEMLNSIMSKYTPKEYAKALCGNHRQSAKSRTRTAVLNYTINEEHHHVKDRRSILQELPADLWNIDSSDFTDILQQLCKTFFLKNTRDRPKEDRGRPKEQTHEETDFGGRYSSYEQSEYLVDVIDVLKKPEIGTVINHLLLEDGLLYRYEKYKNEMLYYLIRMAEEERFWNVVNGFRVVDEEVSKKSPKKVEAFLDKIKGLDERDIQSEVEKAAQASLNRHKNHNSNVFIYIVAGVISMANIL